MKINKIGVGILGDDFEGFSDPQGVIGVRGGQKYPESFWDYILNPLKNGIFGVFKNYLRQFFDGYAEIMLNAFWIDEELRELLK